MSAPSHSKGSLTGERPQPFLFLFRRGEGTVTPKAWLHPNEARQSHAESIQPQNSFLIFRSLLDVNNCRGRFVCGLMPHVRAVLWFCVLFLGLFSTYEHEASILMNRQAGVKAEHRDAEETQCCGDCARFRRRETNTRVQ